MLTKRVKWVVLIGSILCSLICVFGCSNLADNFNTTDSSEKGLNEIFSCGRDA